jgi:hypothetical protein
MSTPSGYTTHKHLKSKLTAGIAAVAGLAALAMPFGAASADSYSSTGNNSYRNTGYVSNNYRQNNSYGNYNNNKNNYSSRNSYGNSSYPVRYSSYNNRDNYNNNYGNKYSSYNNRYMQRYSNYRMVYDPCLHRMVMIRYNNFSKCWEYCDSGQRYTSQVY